MKGLEDFPPDAAIVVDSSAGGAPALCANTRPFVQRRDSHLNRTTPQGA